MKYLRDIRGVLVALSFAIAVMLLAPLAKSVAQNGFTIPPNTAIFGLLATNGKPPVGTGCTIAAGSTDMAGECTTTTTSGTIVFAKTDMVNPPFCIVVDQTATPVAVFDVTALQITLTTVTSAHKLRWHCEEQAGL